MLHQPAGLHAHMLGVGVPADVPHLVQGDIGILPAADETDRFPLEQDLALVPVVFAPHDGEVDAVVLQRPETVTAVVGGDSEGDVRALSRVGRQNLRQKPPRRRKPRPKPSPTWNRT